MNGSLSFTDLTTLNLAFNGAGSSVLWSNSLWDSSQSWTIYDVTGTTSNFSNLSLNITDWLDSGSNLFSTTGGTFSLSQFGPDVILNYTVAAIPGPPPPRYLGLWAGWVCCCAAVATDRGPQARIDDLPKMLQRTRLWDRCSIRDFRYPIEPRKVDSLVFQSP